MTRIYGKNLGHMLRVRVSSEIHERLLRRTESRQTRNPDFGLSDLVREILTAHFDAAGPPVSRTAVTADRLATPAEIADALIDEPKNPFAETKAERFATKAERFARLNATIAADAAAKESAHELDVALPPMPENPEKLSWQTSTEPASLGSYGRPRYKAPHEAVNGECAAGCEIDVDEHCLWPPDHPDRQANKMRRRRK